MQAVGSQFEALTTNQQRPTIRAVGVFLPVARHVTKVDEPQAGLPADAPGPLQGAGRGVGGAVKR